MAKQSGIHQIKGKVGEMSYYKQSGVSSGLIRSINPSMSGRVKMTRRMRIHASITASSVKPAKSQRLSADTLHQSTAR